MKRKIIALFAVACIISLRSIAQLPGDSDQGQPGSTVPFDGGLSLALVAGIGYGAKRLMKKKEVAEETNK